MLSYAIVPIPTGSLILTANARGIARLTLTAYRQGEAVSQAARLHPDARYDPDLQAELQRDLQRYFEGDHVRFQADLDLGRLAPFQQRVLDACAAIPWGRTVTYGQLAAGIGCGRAARAVGTALARNPIPIVVPCHRVVPSCGRMGGFSAEQGVALKSWLLELESIGRPPPWPR